MDETYRREELEDAARVFEGEEDGRRVSRANLDSIGAFEHGISLYEKDINDINKKLKDLGDYMSDVQDELDAGILFDDSERQKLQKIIDDGFEEAKRLKDRRESSEKLKAMTEAGLKEYRKNIKPIAKKHPIVRDKRSIMDEIERLEKRRKVLQNLADIGEISEMQKQELDYINECIADLTKSITGTYKTTDGLTPSSDKNQSEQNDKDPIAEPGEKDSKNDNEGEDNTSTPTEEKESDGHEKGNDPQPEPITKIEKAPKLTWKSFAAIAAGVAVGAVVHFTTGGVGNVFAAGTAGLITSQVSKKRGMAQQKRLSGGITEPIDVASVEEAPVTLKDKIKAKLSSIKKYFKSEEGLRDVSYFLNAVTASSMALSAVNLINGLHGTTQQKTNGVHKPDDFRSPSTTSEPTSHDFDTIYKTSADAQLGTNGVSPHPQFFGDGDLVKTIKDGVAEVGQEINGVWQTSGFVPADGLNVGDYVTSATSITR